jgi:hypothetical protein
MRKRPHTASMMRGAGYAFDDRFMDAGARQLA